MIDDEELARRSALGFAEMMAVLGRGGAGPEGEVRRPGAVGARLPVASDNPWFDGAVVPPGAPPPADDPGLPPCLWTLAGTVADRVEEPAIATPCLGAVLADLDLGGADPDVSPATLAEVGALNERAYGQFGVFAPLIEAVRDGRVRAHAIREGGAPVCVTLTLTVGDDLAVHYVATEEPHRRRGLATRLLRSLLSEARAGGMRTATLQASADGLSVYERLGFRRVGTLRGFLRP